MSASYTIDGLLLGATNTTPDQPSSFVQQLLQASVQCVKLSQNLPKDTDYEMYMQDPSATTLATALTAAQATTWETIAKVGDMVSRNVSTEAFRNTTRQPQRYQLVQTAVGDALESCNMKLRIVNKTKKNTVATTAEAANVQSDSFSVPVTNTFSKHQLKRMAERNQPHSNSKTGERPVKAQITYNHRVDNGYTPFRPSLRTKPNACKPLDVEILDGELLSTAITYPHPYREEILATEYNKTHLETGNVPPVLGLKDNDCFWIDTVEDLLLLEQHLNKQSVFALDLEHHAQHSYQGVTCLLQISTAEKDFLIDALVLQNQLSLLNTSFTNPAIVKVVHGCNQDVVWLQRDLGLYLVNIFDTGQAATLLDFPKRSLAALLDHYCGVKADKSYQLADWRQRPLSREMMAYAREDTHYLLHIYHQMKNELITRSQELLLKHQNLEGNYGVEPQLKVKGYGLCATTYTQYKKDEEGEEEDEKNKKDKKKNNKKNDDDTMSDATTTDSFYVPYLLAHAVQRSNKLPLIQYEKENRPVFAARRAFKKLRIFEALNTNSGGVGIDTTTPQSDDTLSLRLFTAVYAWRDLKARELDECPNTVMKNDQIIRICQHLPRDAKDLEAKLKPVNAFLKPLLPQLLTIITTVMALPQDLLSFDLELLQYVDINEDMTMGEDDTADFLKDEDVVGQSKEQLKASLQRSAPQLFALMNDATVSDVYNIYTNDGVDVVSVAANVANKNKKNKTAGALTQEQKVLALQQYLSHKYYRLRYSHPLFFLPDYIRTLLSNDWMTREVFSVGDEDEEEAQTPTTTRLATNNNAAVARLMPNYAQKLNTVQQTASNNRYVPKTCQGINLFEMTAIGGPTFVGSGNAMKIQIQPPAQKNEQQQQQPDATIEMGETNTPTTAKTISLPMITSQRIVLHNITKADDIRSHVTTSTHIQANPFLSTALTGHATNHLNMNKKHITSIINSSFLTLAEEQDRQDDSGDAGDDSMTENAQNPVANYTDYQDNLNASFSQPRLYSRRFASLFKQQESEEEEEEEEEEQQEQEKSQTTTSNDTMMSDDTTTSKAVDQGFNPFAVGQMKATKKSFEKLIVDQDDDDDDDNESGSDDDDDQETGDQNQKTNTTKKKTTKKTKQQPKLDTTTIINPFLNSTTNAFLTNEKKDLIDSLGTVAYNPRNIRADHKDKVVEKTAYKGKKKGKK